MNFFDPPDKCMDGLVIRVESFPLNIP